MININSIASASAAANQLNQNNRNLQRSLAKLSSGLRVNSAYDDAGGLAVSIKLSASIRKTEAASANVGNAVSFLQTQDGVLSKASDYLERMSALAILSMDATLVDDDRDAYDTELTSLKTSFASLLTEEFNGTALFAAATTSLAVTTNENGDTQNITQLDLEAVSTSIGTTALTGETVDTLANATAANTVFTAQILALGVLRATNGGEQMRMTYAQDILGVNQSNLEAANSRIMDVDVARESTEYSRLSIVRESGIAMLAQANTSAQSILRLVQ
jgi:flagellin